MKILMCHNYYQQPGGEDKSFAAEFALLEENGHQVITYTRHNDDIDSMNRLQATRTSIWNSRSFTEVETLIRRHRPDVMHCTNTFPLISPAVYYAAKRNGVAVVQSLRNYRLLCPNALFLRDGQVCEDCSGRPIAWPAIRHRCYRDNRSASTAVAAMLAYHNFRKTWTRMVDMYYALSEFSRSRFVAGGIPGGKIAVKPNFLRIDPGAGSGDGGYAVFVGRLSPEKGINVLLDAWSQLRQSLPLKVVGDGPLAEQVRIAAATDTRIQWLGHRDSTDVMDIIGQAAFSVIPSIWYEGFPRTVIESIAKGTPAVVSRLGSMEESIIDGRTGLHFEAGDAAGLASRVTDLLTDPDRLKNMRQHARNEFLSRYTSEQNYTAILRIYQQALGRRPTAIPGTVYRTASSGRQ